MNRWSRTVVGLAVVFLGGALQASRHVGFETDAFNTVLAEKPTENFVFSPLSFELSCAIVAESLETIPKANVADSMGAAIGLEAAFSPVMESLAARTNGFSFVTARAFCVPEIKKANTAHRQYLENVYATEVLRLYPCHGAESWFKTTMEGDMEDFAIPVRIAKAERYSFYDLVSVKLGWKERFPTANTRKMRFHPTPGETISVECLSDIRYADTCETKEYVALRLPLEDDAWFYAILPNDGFGFDEIRADISSMAIDRFLAGFASISDPEISHGSCAIVLPKFTFTSRIDLMPAFVRFKVPTKGLVSIAPEVSARELIQYVKVEVAECGVGQTPLVEKPAEAIVPLTKNTKKLVFNRPYLFFVYDEKTSSIPVAGVYTGR